MKIFSGSSNKPLAAKIAKELDLKLSDTEIFIFPDGERRVRILENVVDEDVVVVETTSPLPDSHYMELFFLVDAVKRSGAGSITAVVPYLGYQRQDHVFRDGEAVSLEVVIKTLEAVGMDRLITLDLHSIKIPELFKIPIDHLSALPIFAEKVKELLGKNAEVAHENFRVHSAGNFLSSSKKARGANAHNENFVSSPHLTDTTILVSPDMGGIRRIKILSELLDNMPYVSIIKDRDLESGNISSNKFDTRDLGWQKNAKRAIIVDDMISTGRTIVAAVNLLIANGIKNNFVFATHPVFSGDARSILQSSKASKIFVTDSIDITREKRFEKLEVLSIAGEIAKVLSS